MKTHRAFLQAILVLLTVAISETVLSHDDSRTLPNFDARRASRSKSRASVAEIESAASRIRARIPGLKVDLNEVIDSPKFVYNQLGFLSGATSEDEILHPRTLQSPQAPKSDHPHAPIKRFLGENTDLFGFDAAILDSARISREFVTAHNGLRTVVWEQDLDGIPIFEAVLYGHITRNGELASLSSQFIPDPVKAADTGTPNRAALQLIPAISDREAVAVAATNISESLSASDVSVIDAVPEGAERKRRFTAPALTGDATAALVWLPMDRNTMRLCWRVILTGSTSGKLFQVLVDARTGEAQLRHCWTFGLQNASYRVFASDSPSPFSPGHLTPNSNQPTNIQTPGPEYVSQVDMTLTSISSVASPDGWVNTNPATSFFINTTIGNNVDAHTDLRGTNDPPWDQALLTPPNPPRPTGTLNGSTLEFKFTVDLAQAPNQNSPARNQDAAVVNAFYWANWMHDKLYDLGFTEAAGNYQQNNFGRGGVGGDAVLVDVQNGANNGERNQNWFSITPIDGTPGRMTLSLFDGPASADLPDRDAAFEAETILHEYTHGMFQRLVGHGAGFSGNQAMAMNEGWADFFPLSLLSGQSDAPDGVYPFGAYSFWLWPGFSSVNGGSGTALQENYYYGKTTYPYSTQLSKSPYTFKDLDPMQASNHAGTPRNPAYKPYPGSNPNANEIQQFYVINEFCFAIMWEARANLIAKHGFLAGNDLILRLATDAMKLCPPNPTIGQARDAILLADRVYTGGTNQNALWTAFAKRGLG